MKGVFGGIVFAICCLVSGGAVHAHQGAGFGYKGAGATLEFDDRIIATNHLQGYTLLKLHCLKCHNQERIVRHLQNNISKGSDYEVSLKALIQRKIRLTGGKITKPDAKHIMDFLVEFYRIELTEHKKRRQ